ncbi:hypothetical protein NQ314_016752 [Rhamnusium bicolor]|uniref:CUB domain-containing protein n=1 Tax=Rhamnusium bicolor TaxID=1586634 RepID=A0AAV8WW70_9CUCU|nr:hypothetical protein NQ314_016752 [Rhamnusium bicolor]
MFVKDNGPTGKELLKSCGYRIPNPVFSYTNKLYIKVHHNTTNVLLSRFDFSYTSTENGRGCGGLLYNYKGKFSSPLYPNEFRNESICIWEVRVPIGLQAVLKFTSKYPTQYK